MRSFRARNGRTYYTLAGDGTEYTMTANPYSATFTYPAKPRVAWVPPEARDHPMIQTMATGAPGRCYDCAQRTDEPRYCARCAKAHDWNRDTHPAPPVRDAVPRECMYCERVFDAPHGLVSTCYVCPRCNAELSGRIGLHP